jgi:hypothetical protein
VNQQQKELKEQVPIETTKLQREAETTAQADHPRPHPGEALAEVFWPGDDPEIVRGSLRRRPRLQIDLLERGSPPPTTSPR